MQQAVDDGLLRLLHATPGMDRMIEEQTDLVRRGGTQALKAAEAILEHFRTNAARLP